MTLRNCLAIAAGLLCCTTVAIAQQQDSTTKPTTFSLDPLLIVGTPEQAQQLAGGATVLTNEDLERLNYTDIQRILRQVPGVYLQVEDGYGLRPNISIRGTASERSSRITLLEDNVLIAPAPYAAPSAYYFPTVGRINGVEVLKGPAAITQGPGTVGGALNLQSTPIPDGAAGLINVEAGTDSTWRGHAWYGDSGEQFGWLAETHLWRSDGYQQIDRSNGDTGFQKEDYMVKLRWNTPRDRDGVYHQVDLKLQYAEQDDEQSYLGLTDSDFQRDPFRRYGLSQLDNFESEHFQTVLSYRMEFSSDFAASLTAYNNDFERNWFKTEGIDLDGSANAQEFSRTSWFNVIQAINRGESLGGLSAAELQAIVDGGDTLPGSIQLRSNAREYYSRGIQLGLDWSFATGAAQHQLRFGARYHKDEEDRLQRNSAFSQQNGQLVLDDLGLLGNAGNRVQQGEAWSFFVHDTIDYGRWRFAPGIRFESIEQSRVRYEDRPDRTDDPSSRAASNIRDTRENTDDVFIPGMGVTYSLTDDWTVIGGVHRGFTAPTNEPGVRAEKSINYEFGFRYNNGWLFAEAIGFYNDYENLLGFCTNSSSVGNCEPGDAFNGDAATIAGLEFLLTTDLSSNSAFGIPLRINYTYTDGEFDSDIADTEFFGDVSEGDPIPHIPEHQFNIQLGFEQGPWSTFVNANYVDESCVFARCAQFESVEDAFTVDWSVHFDITSDLQVYALIENIFDQEALLGRLPYGARPNKDRSALIGVRMAL
ncbi:MAG: TonB-dependent receptor [Wenzhouxiangellaceae bacterium]